MTARGMMADDRGNNCEPLIIYLLLGALVAAPAGVFVSRLAGSAGAPAWMGTALGWALGLAVLPAASLFIGIFLSPGNWYRAEASAPQTDEKTIGGDRP